MQLRPPSGSHQDDTAVQLGYSLRSGALYVRRGLEALYQLGPGKCMALPRPF